MVRSALMYDLGYLVATVLAGFLLGWLLDYQWQGMFLALLGFCLWQLLKIYRLVRQTSADRVPDVFGNRRSLTSLMVLQYRSRVYGQIQKRKKTGRSNRQIQQALNTITTGLVQIDDRLNVQWYNTQAGSILSLREQDLQRPINFIVRNPGLVAWLQNSDSDSYTFVRNHRAIQITRVYYADQSQSILELVDQTEVRNLEKVRKNFVANASHELKTPVAVLHGYLEPLSEEHSDDPVYEIMLRQTQRIQTLANSMLQLAEAEQFNDEAGRKTPEIPVMPIVRQCLDEAEVLSGRKHKFCVRIAEDAKIACTANDLQTILSNLLSNAVRFTPETGSIDIGFERDDSQVRLSVRDSGAGIDPQDQVNITRRFYRKGEGSGAGLGLAIVQHLLNRYQATLQIDSQLGDGSTFTCCFPYL